MLTPYLLALGVSLFLFSGLTQCLVSAQAPQPEPVLVLEGATLIDGNGGAPLPDSAIVIRGNRIASVARRGQAAYPPNAHLINAAGKFVMPGLFDSQVSYEWYLPSRSSITASRPPSTSERAAKRPFHIVMP